MPEQITKIISYLRVCVPKGTPASPVAYTLAVVVHQSQLFVTEPLYTVHLCTASAITLHDTESISISPRQSQVRTVRNVESVAH